LFLKQRGYDITAEEPVQGGFDLFEISRDAITSRHQAIGLEVIPLPSAELDPEQHGRFDLIYSYNVVEHIDRLEASLAAMVNLLTDDGVMVHNCPNYFFPYEPHLALPVVKPIKELSERLFKAKIDQKRALWDSLNFVTYGEIRRFARRGQLDVRFAPGLLHAAFARLEDDPLFRQRHGQSVVGRVFRLLSKTRTLSLLKHLPAAVVSPMQFEISRAPSRSPGRS